MRKNLPIYLLIILGIITRFLPHPANFTAIGAVAMFGGLYLTKKQAIWLPLAAMLISDIFIGFYSWPIMFSVYISFALMGYIGLKTRQNKKISTVLFGTVLGGFIFFLITNAAVWLFSALYAKNLSGLINCFYLALPFWRNMLLGDLFYVTMLAGGYEIVMHLKNRRELNTVKII